MVARSRGDSIPTCLELIFPRTFEKLIAYSLWFDFPSSILLPILAVPRPKGVSMAFRFDQLTLKSQEAVQKAQGLARDRGHQRIEPMHLLAALLDPEQAVVR